MKRLHAPLLVLLLVSTPAAFACEPTAFPGAGQRMRVDFPGAPFELDFRPDGCTLTFTGLGGDASGITDTVTYQSVEIAPRVYRLTWARIDPATGTPFTNVVHIQNWNSNQVYSSFSDMALEFTHRQGPLSRSPYPR